MSKSPSQGTLVSAKLGFVPHTSVTSDAAIRKHLVSPRSPDQSCSGHQQCFGQGPTHQICFCFTLLFFPADITLLSFFSPHSNISGFPNWDFGELQWNRELGLGFTHSDQAQVQGEFISALCNQRLVEKDQFPFPMSIPRCPGNVSALQSTFWHRVFHVFMYFLISSLQLLLNCSLSWESVLAACSIYKLHSCSLAVSHSLIIYSSIFCTACLELLFMCWLI